MHSYISWNYRESRINQIFQWSRTVARATIRFGAFACVFIEWCVWWAGEFVNRHIIAVIFFGTLIELIAILWIFSECAWTNINFLVWILFRARWIASIRFTCCCWAACCTLSCAFGCSFRCFFGCSCNKANYSIGYLTSRFFSLFFWFSFCMEHCMPFYLLLTRLSSMIRASMLWNSKPFSYSFILIA